MTFDAVKEIIAEQLSVEPDTITMEATFEDLKIDSLDMVEVVMALEEKFDITIDEGLEVKTVSDLVKHIEGIKK